MVDLKKLKPIGVVMVLVFSFLALILCFTADMGVPKPYTPQHDEAYYTQSQQNMQELIDELEQNEFSRLEGVVSYDIASDGKTLSIYINKKDYDRVCSVLNRDFGESLFDYHIWEG